jgi:hypothetical protein
MLLLRRFFGFHPTTTYKEQQVIIRETTRSHSPQLVVYSVGVLDGDANQVVNSIKLDYDYKPVSISSRGRHGLASPIQLPKD